jgi:hypothetical protein
MKVGKGGMLLVFILAIMWLYIIKIFGPQDAMVFLLITIALAVLDIAVILEEKKK